MNDIHPRRFLPVAILLLCLAPALAQPPGTSSSTGSQAAEPEGSRSNEQKLLRLVPKSMESVFCVNSPADLKQWEDLTEASIVEMATCFSTLLSARQSDSIGLTDRSLRCVVCSVRDIRAPQIGDSSRTFVSKRCELFLLAENLPADWLDKLAKAPGFALKKVGELRFLEITSRGESTFVAQLDDNLLCIVNDAPLLTEVLQLASEMATERSYSIESDPEFRLARSYLSKSPPFWGIRLFGRVVSTKDLTSVRNAKNAVDTYDKRAVFVAIELPRLDALNLPLCYASEDAAAPEQFVKEYRVKKIDEPSVVPYDGGARTCAIARAMLNLDGKRGDVDEPGAVFMGICATFGQGYLL